MGRPRSLNPRPTQIERDYFVNRLTEGAKVSEILREMKTSRGSYERWMRLGAQGYSEATQKFFAAVTLARPKRKNGKIFDPNEIEVIDLPEDQTETVTLEEPLPPPPEPVSLSQEQEIVRKLLDLVNVKMGSGRVAGHLCSVCEQRTSHRDRLHRECGCACHEARRFIGAEV